MPDVTSLDEATATPHAELFDGDPRVVRLRLDAGEGVAAHTHPDRTVLLHVLDGRLDVTLDGETHDLAAGDLVRFDGRREVAPRATDDGPATALVVLSPRTEG